MNKKIFFGFGQLTKETPKFALWLFRITLILTTVATFVIAADPFFNDAFKVRATVYLKAFDMVIFGFSKLFGAEVTDEQ